MDRRRRVRRRTARAAALGEPAADPAAHPGHRRGRRGARRRTAARRFARRSCSTRARSRSRRPTSTPAPPRPAASGMPASRRSSSTRSSRASTTTSCRAASPPSAGTGTARSRCWSARRPEAARRRPAAPRRPAHATPTCSSACRATGWCWSSAAPIRAAPRATTPIGTAPVLSFLEIATQLEPQLRHRPPRARPRGRRTSSTRRKSAKAALAGFAVARSWRHAPRPVQADDLLPERALAGDPLARATLVAPHLPAAAGALDRTADDALVLPRQRPLARGDGARALRAPEHGALPPQARLRGHRLGRHGRTRGAHPAGGADHRVDERPRTAPSPAERNLTRRCTAGTTSRRRACSVCTLTVGVGLAD